MANDEEKVVPADTWGAVSLGEGSPDASNNAAGAAKAQRPEQASGAGGETLTGPIIRDIDESHLQEIVEISQKLPVVVDLWADWCQPCKQLGPVLEDIVRELDGRIVLAKIDVDANPQLAQIFQAQSIPTVAAIIAGRPIPLFQGAQPKNQVVAVFNEILKVAAQAGLTGRMVDAAAPSEPKVNPLHEAALAAEDAGDLEGAIREWETVLNKAPKDQDAKEALARLRLAKRLKAGEDDSPMGRADQAFADGDADSAFGILLDIIANQKGGDDEAVEAARKRILEMFTVLGNADPRVKSARSRLSTLLF